MDWQPDIEVALKDNGWYVKAGESDNEMRFFHDEQGGPSHPKKIETTIKSDTTNKDTGKTMGTSPGHY